LGVRSWLCGIQGRTFLSVKNNMKAFSTTLVVLLFGCSTGNKEQAPDRFDQLFSGKMKMIDLTHSLSADSPYWPGDAGNPFKYDTVAKQPSGAPSMGKYSTPEHFSTHIDAPIHFADHQLSVDQILPEQLVGPAVVIDVSAKCAANPDYLLTSADVTDWENVNGRMPEGAIVLMYTGWSKKWDDYPAYKNEDAQKKMHFPGFSAEVANFLTRERDIKGIGIDNFSVDAGAADGFPAHDITNGAGKFHLENVANVHELPALGAFLIVSPIKIKGGSGGQVRIFAVIPD